MFLPYLDVVCVLSVSKWNLSVFYIIVILVILDKIRNVFKKICVVNCIEAERADLVFIRNIRTFWDY